MKLPQQYQKWLILFALVLTHTFFWVKLKHLHFSDPDTFTYQALARESSQRGFLTTLPQVDDLGWGERFADKNLIFNAVNGLFYKVGGEKGVELSLFLMALAVAAGIFLGAAYFVPLPWAALVTVAAYLNANFVIRLFLLRPHVWAIFCFMGVLLSILHRAPRAAFIFGALFAWGYPVYYLPMALLGLAYAVYGYRQAPSERDTILKVCKSGMAGILFSILLHPAFPANLDWVTAISKIAVNNMALASVELPIENVPQRSDYFMQRFAFFLLVLLGSLAYEAFARREFKPAARRKDYIFLWLLNLGLWGAAFFQPRASEYAIPCTMVLAAFFVWRLLEVMEAKRVLVGFAAFALLTNYVSLIDFYGKGPKFSLNPKVPMAVMASLPAEASGKKVFNCEWEAGAFLLYRRPDVKFVDILDPTFLPKASPGLATQRQYLFEGKLLPYTVIHESFGADYVVCRNPELLVRLDHDPLFTRIFPPMPEPVRQEVAGLSAVYRVRPERLKNFVHAAYINYTSPMEEVVRPTHKRGVAESGFEESKGPYWNLLPAGQKIPPVNGDLCFNVQPTQGEMARLAGSEWLAVGGGPEVMVVLNGKRLARSKDDDGNVDYLRDWIPLPKKITEADKFTFMVCSAPRDIYHGAAFSFWTDKDRRDICNEKGFRPRFPAPSDWKYTFAPPPECFGRIAVADK